MAETLLTPSSIKLFGRVVNSLVFTNDTTVFGGNYFLQRQLAASVAPFDITGTTYAVPRANTVDTIAPAASFANLTVGMAISEIGGAAHIAPGTVITSVNLATSSISIYPAALAAGAGVQMAVSISPKLARIYAFSFEGQYYAVPKPPIFLVHGTGMPLGNWANPSSLDQSGVMGREWDFSGNLLPTDLVYWEYEKGDFSLRLDLDAGPLEQILLQMTLRSGADRTSGAGVSGAGVSGAGVSGAGVSGAGVSGAGVSGAGVRR